MIISTMEPYTKTKFKIYIDGQFAFVLYKGELSRYCLKEGQEISSELVEKIENEVILKRAKLRAMYLLNDMSRTESELRTKLKQNFYTDKVIDAALAYVKSFGYIDDDAYIRDFILTRQNKKSKKELYAELVKKGIPKALIELSMEEYHEGRGEQEAIRKILRKRHYRAETASEDEERKLYGYLARKGFRYDDIQQVLQVSEWNA